MSPINLKRDEISQAEILVHNVDVSARQDSFYPVQLQTSRGRVQGRYYPVEGARLGAIWVGGAGGDWDAPARGLYAKLCHELASDRPLETSWGIASLWIRYRYPSQLEESVLDVLAGLTYLESRGVEAIALIGHSFGGAVVIQAAANALNVRTVVTLATQTFGTLPVFDLSPHCSILLLHGTEDTILPSDCSKTVYQVAQEPKRLVLYPGANHNLDEVAPDVHLEVRSWLFEQLNS
ncbi:MAG: dienelactone hydrolase family protein [Oculatellaceae cyanobacterium Prado106]|jgi:hypothetical protein|nr:dienelactone hydrolase family protein [Oculatellaceae cyanobacterium Prado106]